MIDGDDDGIDLQNRVAVIDGESLIKKAAFRKASEGSVWLMLVAIIVLVVVGIITTKPALTRPYVYSEWPAYCALALPSDGQFAIIPCTYNAGFEAPFTISVYSQHESTHVRALEADAELVRLQSVCRQRVFKSER